MKAEDLYTKVTNDLIARIEAGASGSDWKMPWINLGSNNPKRLTGQNYRGVNWLILMFEQADRGYKSSEWGTFKGWLERRTKAHPDVCVRKGSKGTHVFLWKKEQPSKKMLAADPDAKPYLLARTFTVFNREQVDGLPDVVAPALAEHDRWDEADAYFRTIGANVTEDGDRAYYAPANDRIAVPKLAQFKDPDDFYTTLAHEHVHWTGHKDRLDRDLHNRFGSEAYAAEELIAELGAAFWGAQMDMTPAKRQDHASYLASWLAILRNDKKAIVTAASKAQMAVDFLNKAAGWGEHTGDTVCETAA